MATKTKPQPEVKFDFIKESGGKEIMHWLGTPCFIKKKSRVFCGRVTIVTFDGLVFHRVSLKDLETMDLIDMAFI
jgi:hypothetical protein